MSPMTLNVATTLILSAAAGRAGAEQYRNTCKNNAELRAN